MLRPISITFSFLLLLVTLTGCDSRREIVSDLDEKEANEIVVFLSSHDIPAQKQAKATTGAGADTAATYNITVPAADASEALAILNRNGLPRRPTKSLLSIFAKSGLVSSAQEEQIRYQEGLSRQIAGVIRKIDGVLDADVQISFPATEAGLGGDIGGAPGPVRASVYVKHTGVLDDPNTQLVTKIKRLVAGSVVSLSINDVTVVTDKARFSQSGFEGATASPDDMQWSRVWSVIVAKGSVSRFQTIFFTLLIVLLVVAALVAWILWKLFPLIQESGGLTALFTGLKPLQLGDAPEQNEDEEEMPPEGEE